MFIPPENVILRFRQSGNIVTSTHSRWQLLAKGIAFDARTAVPSHRRGLPERGGRHHVLSRDAARFGQTGPNSHMANGNKQRRLREARRGRRKKSRSRLGSLPLNHWQEDVICDGRREVTNTRWLTASGC